MLMSEEVETEDGFCEHGRLWVEDCVECECWGEEGDEDE